MPLIVTPPTQSASLWQSVCQDHGLLIHATRQALAVMTARLHEWEGESRCFVVTGGLRCMFCLSVVDADHWPPGVQLSCQHCYHLAVNGRLPDDHTVHDLSYFATKNIRPVERLASHGLVSDHAGQQTGAVNY